MPVLLRKLKEIFTEAFTEYLKKHRETHLSSFHKDNDLERDFHLPTEVILAKLNADQEAPWADWRYGKEGKEGKGLSPHKLGHYLRRYKVKSVQEERARGYLYGELKPVFERYI